ncbi:MAG: hypothetical protein PSN34_03405 [Urechidicola sp.]|nr:hypothetical protein [Urechidicola sp.]
MKTTNSTILALYPNAMGVCYAVFDSPKDLVDYGIEYIRPVCSKKSLLKVKQYLDFYRPDIVLLRGISKQRAKHSKRTKKLIDLICEVAKSKGLEVHKYNRRQIQNVFSQFKAVSKYQVSKKITEWFPELKALELPIRKRWMSENHRTGIFDAIAIALVHFYVNE